MRVLIVTPEFQGLGSSGGIGTFAYHLSQFYLAHNVDFEVLITAKAVNGARELSKPHNKIRITNVFVWGAQANENSRLIPETDSNRASVLVHRYLLSHPKDLVVLQDYLGHGLRALQAKRTGLAHQSTTFVTALHGLTEWALEGLQRFPEGNSTLELIWQEREAVRLSDKLIAPSNYMRNYLTSKGLNLQHIDICPYPYFPSNETTPKGRKTSKNRTLVYMGRLETRKGFEMFLKALDVIFAEPKIASSTDLLILGNKGQLVGGGAPEQLLYAFKLRNPSVEVDQFEGLDAASAWQHVRERINPIIVLPSLVDNFPYAVIEAYDSGYPLITCEIGGIPEIVRASKHVSLCRPFPHELANALRVVLMSSRDETTTKTQRYENNDKLLIESYLNVKGNESRAHRNSNQSDLDITHEQFKKPAQFPLSVVITHFNYSKVIEQAIQSLLNQTTSVLYKIYVVDDRSDELEKIKLKEIEYGYSLRGPFDNLEFLYMDINRGAARLRNYMARTLSSEYIIFFDADNVALPNFIETLYKSIRFSGATAVTCFSDIIDTGLGENLLELNSEATLVYTPMGGDLGGGFYTNNFGDAAAIFNRVKLLIHDGFSTDGADSANYETHRSGDWDWELFAKITLQGGKVQVAPYILQKYRRHSNGQFSQNQREFFYKSNRVIVDRFSKELGLQQHGLDQWLLALRSNGTKEIDIESELVRYCTALSEEGVLAQLASLRENPIRNLKKLVLVTSRLVEYLSSHSESRLWVYGAGDHSKLLFLVEPSLLGYVHGFLDSSREGTFLGKPIFCATSCIFLENDVLLYSSKASEGAMFNSMKHLALRHIRLYGDSQ